MQAMRLIEMWLEQGHEVICLGRRMGNAPVVIASRHVETHRIRTSSAFGRLGRALTYAVSLAWLLLRLRHRVDLVYTRFLGEAAAVAAVLKRLGLLNAPLVATPANTGSGGDIGLIKSIPLSRRIIRLMDAQCGAINLIASDMIEELKAEGFSGRNFTTIPNGIRVRPACERNSPTPVRCIAVGRLAPQKGYDILLEALARIKEHLVPGQFVIAGSGPERARLEQMSKDLGVSAFVVWRGELDQQTIQDELCMAQVYLLPSRYEGMSNAGLEAMERSLPVVLTECGGLDRYVTPQMGWVVRPEDPDGLASAILAALNERHEQLAARGSRCRQLIEELFNIELTSRRYTALFDELRQQGLHASEPGT
nr:glycosyltransferase family 4 protein [Dyella acidiphila]